ncbi:hypothetical protein F4778DRAFT_731218 [Xylariomycetidae sp. FL2044]|nr:hypothetical protein F4778DRAFT_731218 [Xylariomycetidae sp. FL2044]
MSTSTGTGEFHATRVPFGQDVLAYLNLQDSDTAIKKRNRNAQRSHREKKRAAVAAAAPSSETGAGTGERQPAQTSKPTKHSRRGRGGEKNHGIDVGTYEVPPESNPMLIGMKGAFPDQPNVSAGDWSTSTGLMDNTHHVSLIGGPSGADPSFDTGFNFGPSPDSHHPTWYQDQMGTIVHMNSLPSSHSGSMHAPGNQADNMDFDSEATTLIDTNPLAMSYDGGSEEYSNHTQQSTVQASDGSFEAILDAVDSAGFHSFDEMATAYYTLSLEEDSALHGTQRFSRERLLRNFLKALGKHAPEWSDRETWAYQEETLSSAYNILSEELSRLAGKSDSRKSTGRRKSRATASVPETRTEYSPVMASLEALLQDSEMNSFLKQEIRGLREGVPDAWALLTKLTQDANIGPPMNSRLVAMFLHLLVQGGSRGTEK